MCSKFNRENTVEINRIISVLQLVLYDKSRVSMLR